MTDERRFDDLLREDALGVFGLLIVLVEFCGVLLRRNGGI